MRGRVLGRHSQEYRVRLPSTIRDGELVQAEARPPLIFAPSSWVTDDLSKVVPKLLVGTASYAPAFTEKIWEDPSAQHWRLVYRAEGLWAYVHMQVSSGDDAVEWQALVGFSDPTTPDMQRTYARIALQFGEVAVCDDPSIRTRLVPVGVGAGTEIDLASGPTTLGDGQCLPPVRGAVLCLPKDVPLGFLLGLNDSDVRARIANLYARIGGPTWGWASDWEGDALCFGEVPKISNTVFTALRGEAGRFFAPKGLWDARPRAQAPNANQTGGQAEFGAIEGTELWKRHGMSLPWLMWNAGHEALRPSHFREADGSRVLAANHPDWVTWSQRTHWHNGQSRDRLGKPHPEPWFESHGWKGEDEEHANCNLIAAVYALTGDRVLEELILDDIAVESANVRVRQLAVGATRALGRRLHANSLRDLLTDHPLARAVIDDLVRDAHETWVGGRYPEAVVRPIDTITAATYLRNPETGEPWESISMWEHGLMAMGAHATWMRAQRSSSLEMLIIAVNALLLEHAWFQEGGQWKHAEIIHFDEGRALPPAYYLNGGRPGWVKVSGTFTSWVGHAAKWVARADHGITFPPALLARAEEVTAWLLALPEAGQQDREEWFAVAGRRN